jgi:lipopolysaccharide transport system ATP-binding protein
VRLAFSVSAHLDPDILILDEVLAVGDMRFQRKCIDKMQLAGREGRTLIFVSHSTQAIVQTCKSALYLKEGRMRSYGPVESVISDYTLDNVVAAPSAGDVAAGREAVSREPFVDNWLQGEYKYVDGVSEIYREAGDFADLVGARLLDTSGQVSARLPIHQPFRCVLRYRLRRDIPFRVVPNFHFYLEDGQRFFIAFPEHVAPSTEGEYEATCVVPPFLINTGRYTVALILSSYELPNPVHFAADRALRFEIHEPAGSDPRRHGWNGGLPGVSRPHLAWEIDKK